MTERGGLRLIRSAECEPGTPSGHWNMEARTLHDSRPLRVQYCEMHADGGAEAHVHDAQDQVMVVVEGALEVGGNGGAPLTARRGDAVYVSAGAAHATRPASPEGARYVVLTFPAADAPE